MNRIIKKLQFSIAIEAPREKVWNTLWQEKTFREWADIIDPGMYIDGDLKEGNRVKFMSPNGFGVTSLVERFIPNELVSFRHMMDTKEGEERKNEWTGGKECYSLTENSDLTTLTIELDTPPEQEDNFKVILPKVLECVKMMSEGTKE
jgi:uncharacterized protein YndB with AHSA1/START domain